MSDFIDTISFAGQAVGLESILNVRELGGYVMPDGRRIRKGMLLRGGSLAKASDSDIARLSEEFHLTYNFDFRTENEVTHSPDREVPGAKRVWLPAIDPETEKMADRNLPKQAYINLNEYLLDRASDPLIQTVAAHLYTNMVDNEYTQLQYSAFLQIIASQADGAVYWHCSQGKDRTGLGAAFLLAALGAGRDLILADYALSEEYYRKDVEMLCAELHKRGGGEAEDAVIRTFVGVNVDYFIDALDLIDRKYGSMDNYISSTLMLSEEDRNKLRDRLLE